MWASILIVVDTEKKKVDKKKKKVWLTEKEMHERWCLYSIPLFITELVHFVQSHTMVFHIKKNTTDE